MLSISAGHRRMVSLMLHRNREGGVLRSNSYLMFLDKQADIHYATVLLRRGESGVTGAKNIRKENRRILKGRNIKVAKSHSRSSKDAKKKASKKAAGTKATDQKNSSKAAAVKKDKSGKKKASTAATGRAKRLSCSQSETSKVLKKSPLTKKQIETFRSILLEKRKMLLGDLDEISEDVANHQKDGNLSNMPTHMADIGTDNFEHELNLGLMESEQRLLGEINEALRRIEEGTYGICLGTGKPIPIARLRAKPWARYTVEYARMLEQGLVDRPVEGANEDFDDEGEDVE